MRSRPGFTLVIMLTLALGIALSATVFSTVNAVLIRPLPFTAPDELVALNESQPKLGTTWMPISPPNLYDWQEQNQVFLEISAFARSSFNLSTEEEPERIQGAKVSATLFPLLGIEPILGRHFTASEDEAGGPLVVLISHDLWQRQFDSDPGVIGRTLRLDGRVHEIVGVMPPRFEFPEWAKLWTPVALDRSRPEQRDDRWLQALARLAPNVSLEEAATHMSGLAIQLEKLYPASNTGWSVHVRPLRELWMPKEAQVGSWSMLGAVGFVLLIVCANLANLMLAQAVSRRPESALRTALGASRNRLARQVLTESTLTALLGGGIGVLIASWAVVWVESLVPVPIPYWIRFDLDGRVLGFTLLVTVVSGILSGLMPSVKVAGSNAHEFLKEGGIRAQGGPHQGRVRNLFITAEFALSLVLLVGALFLTKSVLRLQDVETGYATDRILTMRLSLTADSYDRQRRRAFLDEVLNPIQELPQVQSAGAVNYLPASRMGYDLVYLEVEGQPYRPGEEVAASYHAVTSEYLQTMDIGLLEGRMFSIREWNEGGDVVLVSRRLAEALWPGENPLGRGIRNHRVDSAPWLTVIGVTSDVEPAFMIGGLDTWPEYQFYVPYAQDPAPIPTLAIRTVNDPAAVAAEVRAQVELADPSVPVFEVLTMEQVLVQVFWVPRFWSQMFSMFALLALIVATVGIYGVTAYSVSRRIQEMGIRLALGARPRDLVTLIVGQGMRLAAIGTAIGLAIAFAMTRFLSSLLREVTATDPEVYLSVILLLGAVAFLASYFPARRATRVDAIVALKHE
jgi:putative ABC transport system permease protein